MRRILLLLAFTFFAVGWFVVLATIAEGHHKEGHDGGNKYRQAECDGGSPNEHPSGKDRECEPEPGGQSGAEPDQDGKGPERDSSGTDKPGGTGGTDSDRDGNNGCGNDDDFDDDNEGLCGGQPKPVSSTPAPAVSPKPTPSSVPTVLPSEVPTHNQAATPTATVGETPVPVLDETPSPESTSSPVVQQEEDASLPLTGADFVTYLIVAAGAIAIGALLWKGLS